MNRLYAEFHKLLIGRIIHFLVLLQEKLQALVLQLTEECSQLRSAQNRQILELQTQLQSKLSSQTSCNQEELTECKRNSCGDIQQYLQEGLRFLENRCGR